MKRFTNGYDDYNSHKRSRSNNGFGFYPAFNGLPSYIPPYFAPPPTPQHLQYQPSLFGPFINHRPSPQWSNQRRVLPKDSSSSRQDIELPRDNSIADSYPQVTDSIMSYLRNSGQNDQMMSTKLNLRRQFERALKFLFPRCDLFMFGSSASGFGSKSSDMDMCLVTNDHVQVRDVKLLYRIKAILSRQFPMHEVLVINAKVPILKFVHSTTEIQCDLNINNSDGVRNTHLLKYFTKSDPRLVPLVLAIKKWARHHKINDASQGTLSSYALTLMAIHYLQCGVVPPVLPNLLEENQDTFHPRRPLHTLSFDRDQVRGNFRSRCSDTVGELFVGFLNYFANDFNYDYFGISLREARPIQKRTAKEFSKWLFIEEPYNLDNVARAVQKRNEYYIKQVIDGSWKIIKSTKDFESIVTFSVDGADQIVSFEDYKQKERAKNVEVKKLMGEDNGKSKAKSEGEEKKASPQEPQLPEKTTQQLELRETLVETPLEPPRSDIVDLYELSSKRSFNVTFDQADLSGPSNKPEFTMKCSVIYTKGGTEIILVSTGKGGNKKLAKNNAAKEMLARLKEKSLSLNGKESFP